MDTNLECNKAKSSEHFLSPCSSNISNNFGDPVLIPRVGDQYQAEISPLMMNCYDFQNDFVVGLPILLTWGTQCEVEDTKNESIDIGRTPVLICKPWGAIEQDSFLLGLYIFGKNLNLVKKFVESKEMGDILRYYYGKFYRSSEHRRWSRGRKTRSRRCIRGEKIFRGWRQQEVLSRLFSLVTEECQSSLRELSTKYGECKISLEEYVFTLRDKVGIDIFVEAIGIGKRKQDLTRTTTMDRKKANKLLSSGPEIRSRKVFSSLTSEDIVKFLDGDVRLSKARSSDLFWEAVWPRLLARGWHSEQPKDHNYFSSKQSLVFIIPGVKKFSRRKLVKGIHYFDSATDVLNKVASDPSLLEVKIEAEKKEDKTDLEIKQFPDKFLNGKCHSYLQPPVANENLVKFTIVDTSLLHGGERSKVIELRTLPDERTDISILSDFPSEPEQDLSEESRDEAERLNNLVSADDSSKSESICGSPESSGIQENGACTLGKSIPITENIYTGESPCGNSSSTCENTESQVGPFQNLSSGSCLAKGSLDKNEDDIVDHDSLVIETSFEKPRTKKLIDLNLPPFSQELETDGTFIKKVVREHDDSGTKRETMPSLTSKQSLDVGTNTEPALNGRRQSTRNRPPTTKALEAIAYGYLSTNRKRKFVDAQNNSMSRSSRRGRSTDSSTLSSSTDNDIE